MFLNWLQVVRVEKNTSSTIEDSSTISFQSTTQQPITFSVRNEYTGATLLNKTEQTQHNEICFIANIKIDDSYKGQ